MRYLLFLMFIGPCTLLAKAQFEWGGTAGSFLYELRSGRGSRRGFEMHEKAQPFTLGVWYQDHPAGRFGLRVGATWCSYRFHVEYYTGGIGPGEFRKEEVLLDQFHFEVLPEFSVGRKRRVFLRTGLQLGLGVSGTIKGTTTYWSPSPPMFITDRINGHAGQGYRADTRLYLGSGIQLGLFDNGVCYIDPYLSYGISSLKKNSYPWYTMELGCRLSLGLRSSRRSLLQRMLDPVQ